MTWTKRHSQNAVAAKARLRLERAQAEPHFDPKQKVRVRCAAKPDFKITIEAKSGERTQVSLRRFGKSFLTENGLKSARDISRSIEMLLRFYV